MSEKEVLNTQPQEQVKVTKKPHLVFISHDTRDAELAELFSKLLSSASMGILKSFRSSDKRGTQGIEYGVEWYPEIMKKLSDASDVVCLLTKHSVEKPWILFEAGVAKGKLDTPLIGIALGIPLQLANNGPFAQFQNCGDDEDSLTKLVMTLIKKIPDTDPSAMEDVIRGVVKTFISSVKPILEKTSLQINTPIKNEIVEDSQTAKLFEEIKIMFQDLPSRIDKNINSETKRFRRRIHPMMIEELMHFSMKNDDTIGFIMVLSLFRNEIPWLYDFGIDLVRTIKSKAPRIEKEKAIHDFERLIEYSTHNPIIEEFYSRSKEEYMMFREIPHILLKNVPHLFEKYLISKE